MVNQKEVTTIQKSSAKYNAKLVAVTKKRTLKEVQELYALGLTIFGENRVQDLLEREAQLPKDIEWHLIGHLQRNKVKFIVPFIKMIQSVDSKRLLQEIQKQAKKEDRIIDCLLQFHVAKEASKFGLDPKEITAFMSSIEELDLSHINICGVMGMASFVEDENQVRAEFKTLDTIYKTLKDKYFKEDEQFNTLSMGMSGDYEIALEEGSTLIRVGSKLFT